MAFRPNPLSIMRKKRMKESEPFLECERRSNLAMSIKLKEFSSLNQNNGMTNWGSFILDSMGIDCESAGKDPIAAILQWCIT